MRPTTIADDAHLHDERIAPSERRCPAAAAPAADAGGGGLLAVLLVAGGFVGGVVVQKRRAATTARGRECPPRRARGTRAAGPAALGAAPGAGGGAGGSTSAPTPRPGRSGTSTDGTLYVTDASGTTVKVKTPRLHGHAQRPEQGHRVHPGDIGRRPGVHTASSRHGRRQIGQRDRRWRHPAVAVGGGGAARGGGGQAARRQRT